MKTYNLNGQTIVTDLDRNIKIESERATIESTEQLDQHTNNGFRVEQKQLY